MKSFSTHSRKNHVVLNTIINGKSHALLSKFFLRRVGGCTQATRLREANFSPQFLCTREETAEQTASRGSLLSSFLTVCGGLYKPGDLVCSALIALPQKCLQLTKTLKPGFFCSTVGNKAGPINPQNMTTLCYKRKHTFKNIHKLVYTLTD